MAKRASIRIDGPSQLGQRIERYLRESKITGDTLQDQMHSAYPGYIPVPTKISKYVTRGRPAPSSEFLAAVAVVLGMTEAEAADLAARPAVTGGSTGIRASGMGRAMGRPTFTLLMGHTIWSSPIILAAMEGRIPSFRVATYLRDDGEPVFIDPAHWRENVRVDRNALETGRPPVPGPCTTTPIQIKPLRCLSAVSACDLLTVSEVADAVVIPGRLADDRSGDLFRIGCIADTHVGCLLVCNDDLGSDLCNKASQRLTRDDWQSVVQHPHPGQVKRLEFFPPEISAEWLARFLLPQSSDTNTPTSSRVVALEQGAISHKLLQSGCDVFYPGEGEERATSLVLPCTTNEMEEATFDSLAGRAKNRFSNNKDLVGVVTWDPAAQWFKRLSEAKWLKDRSEGTKLYTYGLTFPLDSAPRHLTFDICMRLDDALSEDARHVELRQQLASMIEELSSYCERLNLVAARSRPNARASLSQLAKLSNYFALAETEIDEELPHTDQLDSIRAALAPVRFDASIYASALRRYSVE